jgi:hypothetical protein
MPQNYRIIITLIFLFLQISVFAQTIRLSGTVFDKEMQISVSGVSIHTKDDKTGTISTIKGKFSVEIPASKANGYLYFTSIEYETDSLLISKAKSPLSIQLTPKVYTLKEFYIMPDSALLTLLRKAYSKIPENYPDQPTLYKGFFQESDHDEKGNLIELVEAILSVYKESYQKKRTVSGQIEILKSRNIQIKDIGLDTYGGAFISIESDFVLQRNNFINPDKMKNYQYEFKGIKTLRGMDCYEIEFNTAKKSNSNVQGTILIEVETLAYVSFEINGLYKENKILSAFTIPKIKSKENIIYEQKNGKWYLKQATSNEQYNDSRHNRILYSNMSFLTIDLQIDSVKPISIEKRLNYMDLILSKTNEYNPKGWTDSDILANEDTNQLNFQFSSDETSDIFNQPPLKKSLSSKILNAVSSKLTVGLGISYNHVSFDNISNDISFQPNETHLPLLFSENRPSTNEMVSFQYIVGYQLNKKWSFYGQVLIDGFNKNISSKERGLGIKFKKNLNSAGYPFFLGFSLFISDRNYYRDLGLYKNNMPFSYNNTNLDSKELAFSYGVKEQTIAPQLSISKKISKLITMEVYANYHFAIHSEYGIHIKEKSGFFLSRKDAFVNINDSKLTIDNSDALKNGISVNRPQIGIVFYLF